MEAFLFSIKITPGPGVYVTNFADAVVSRNAELLRADGFVKSAGNSLPTEVVARFLSLDAAQSFRDEAYAHVSRTLEFDEGPEILILSDTPAARSHMGVSSEV